MKLFTLIYLLFLPHQHTRTHTRTHTYAVLNEKGFGCCNKFSLNNFSVTNPRVALQKLPSIFSSARCLLRRIFAIFSLLHVMRLKAINLALNSAARAVRHAQAHKSDDRCIHRELLCDFLRGAGDVFMKRVTRRAD